MLKSFANDQINGKDLIDLVDIMLGYLEEEVFNLVDGRVLPGKDVAGRVVNNLERLFTPLIAKRHDGIVLSEQLERPLKATSLTKFVRFK